jgi:hypothetical protein
MTGKGLEVYYALNEEDASNYPVLKRCILNRYELNEGFRKKFKNSRPEKSESGPQYATRLVNYFKRWVDLATTKQDKEGIVELLICDQFLHSIPLNMATFIRERKPKDIDAMCELADQYIQAHGGWWYSSSSNKGKSNGNYSNREYSNSRKPKYNAKTNESSKSKPNFNSSQKFKGNCWICEKPGHQAKDCRNKHRMNAILEAIDESKPEIASHNRTKESVYTPANQHSDGNDCSDKAAFMMVCTNQPEVIPNKVKASTNWIVGMN